MIKHPLPPIVFSDSKVLILGSFPSVLSRKNAFYYANPSNRFWKVLSLVFEEEISDKQDFLKKHKLALWDVVASCDLRGSSDSSIKNVEVNNFDEIFKKASIQLVIFNGKKAEEIYRKKCNPFLVETITLSSTSSANAQKKLDDLVNEYRKLKVSYEEN